MVFYLINFIFFFFLILGLLDFTKYSLHEAKKEEMECQVRLIELESELTNQREKLATLRKQNYHL